ncbi:aminodeoxychorismate/anthranilate synthase component II [Fructilactobacillus myrtifloralis]|uniref:Aminodeoxychorismate/anthranilate synthase component II n=1 Tax=Fructilactobacillus myrtifloralis TaxID=2940301 RepID=A0ABY5BPG1_9LACO|nr:aminodeoxychorismate/anthranilate synthase component II [Fructilactobacillus myrtifloralis]USS85590.1 aminodeoxychorismate/anthranilate synthase component II [Fructilactobacillus myrtifloralis]
MILLIDNYDSFTYNLYQLLGQFTTDIRVIKNDELTVAEIQTLHPAGIVLSPGPGNPDDAGVSLDVVRQLHGQIPMLGVCMGLQVMIQAYHGHVVPAQQLLHGKATPVRLNPKSVLFHGAGPTGTVARYHSLVGERATLPAEFTVTAVDEYQELMAAEIPAQQLYGVQFHPESILTEDELGERIVENFLRVVNEKE